MYIIVAHKLTLAVTIHLVIVGYYITRFYFTNIFELRYMICPVLSKCHNFVLKCTLLTNSQVEQITKKITSSDHVHTNTQSQSFYQSNEHVA